MKKGKILVVALIGLLMAGGLHLASCKEEESCDDKNNCSAANNEYFCGKSSCAADAGYKCSCN